MQKLAKMNVFFIVALVFGVLMICPTSDAADKKIVVGFSQIGAESAWRVANTESIISEAKKHPNIVLKFSDAQQKQENQIKAIRSFIAQGVDVIAFSPVVETGWTPVLKEAKRAGFRSFSVTGRSTPMTTRFGSPLWGPTLSRKAAGPPIGLWKIMRGLKILINQWMSSTSWSCREPWDRLRPSIEKTVSQKSSKIIRILKSLSPRAAILPGPKGKR